MSRINVKRVAQNSKFTTRIPLQRFGGGDYNHDGQWESLETDPAALSLRCSVQESIGPDQRRLLPEGVRNDVAIMVISTTQLKLEDEAAGTPADQVTFNGRQWVVSASGNWNLYGYYFAVCTQLAQRDFS